MRFLIGIAAGAALTLAAASAVDLAGERPLDWLGSRASHVWNELLAVTSDSLFRDDARSSTALPSRVEARPEETSASVGAPDRTTTPLGRLEEPDQALEPIRAKPVDESPVPAAVAAGSTRPAAALQAEPEMESNILTLVTDAPASQGQSTREGEGEGDEVAAADAAPPAVASGVGPWPSAARQDATGDPTWLVADGAASSTGTPGPVLRDPAGAEATTGGADVWVPFHSQMSARGFAARLSRELEQPFAVERRGAGFYQVVFDGPSEEQAAVLARIRELTGQETQP